LKNVVAPVTGYRVLQGGQAPRPLGSQADGRREPAAPPPPADGAQVGFVSRAWEWYIRLPRLSAVMIAIVVFLFAINMFSGLNHVWFQWPAAVLLLIAFLRAASRNRRS
jgi:adenylate cyclase